MGIPHATIAVNGIRALKGINTGYQRIHQSIHGIIVEIIGIDIGAKHGAIRQHGGFIYGNASVKGGKFNSRANVCGGLYCAFRFIWAFLFRRARDERISMAGLGCIFNIDIFYGIARQIKSRR